ncbi:MAG: 5-amino-6-(D-ribitylamino)uracil--L-tyrosine 4-hydroxyphenyl transferase CofH [Hyphomonadaceae bacterium]|nr:5-amino-6-(D-ribitylamino)uracil--L-tyrosine 4-hydroxyphenyl transferase CofH [Hyphomonadaceae bacterium]
MIELAQDEQALIDRLCTADLAKLQREAFECARAAHGGTVTYSRKVFLPVTHLCRNTCRYCVFAESPNAGAPAFMTPEEVLAVAQSARALACDEALFTLGDKPEERWPQAADALRALGFSTTLEYVGHLARLVFERTGLLPHLNAGVMTEDEMRALRPAALSMGLMLESVSPRLCEKGGPHFGCPDKHPSVRLATIEAAGRLKIPYTTGILIGIGETRRERLESLIAIKNLHRQYGHIQEVIVQPFRAKPGTRMASAPEPDLADLCWTIAAARIILGAEINIQSPPNLTREDITILLESGANDLGGISPLTPDFVNPEAPWPHVGELKEQLSGEGWRLTERLALYPSYVRTLESWVDPGLHRSVRRRVDASGLVREDEWEAGVSVAIPTLGSSRPNRQINALISSALSKVRANPADARGEIASLFDARGDDARAVCEAADAVRREQCGDRASYVVNRNVNYTNVCTFKCGFCAFSKSRVAQGRRETPYNIELSEIERRVAEAWARGATEVCLQGGIHPDFTGETYLEIVRAAKRAAPAIHVHAFSPLEITHGASTLGLTVRDYLQILKREGLGSLPGTAAEILSDDVREIICPDKLKTAEWLAVLRDAHSIGLPTTSTIMFGHVDTYAHWAKHLLALRALQTETGGLTEFVPLAFVAAEAPIFHRGGARSGPTFREALLMHAVARLVLSPLVANIQASWVKMGAAGAQAALCAGANDLGGSLMNESITRAAGALHGQEMAPQVLEQLITAAGRQPWMRTTLYQPAPESQRALALDPPTLSDLVLRPVAATRRQQQVTA